MTLTEFKKLNKSRGYHFFDIGTMRFFLSKIESRMIQGRYFITSEQFEDTKGTRHARKYTIREAREDGGVNTIGEYQEFTTYQEALERARDL